MYFEGVLESDYGRLNETTVYGFLGNELLSNIRTRWKLLGGNFPLCMVEISFSRVVRKFNEKLELFVIEVKV